MIFGVFRIEFIVLFDIVVIEMKKLIGVIFVVFICCVVVGVDLRRMRCLK